jgi:alpha-1,3-mannosyltransferase
LPGALALSTSADPIEPVRRVSIIQIRNWTPTRMKTEANELSATDLPAGNGRLIVHVVRQFLPNRGGLEDVVANLCRQALRHGYRVRVVTLDRLFSDPAQVLPERERIDGIDIVRIPWKGSSRYPVAPQVLRHIADADLVHVHAVDFFFDFLALTRPLHKKRMIATTHGGFFHTRRFAAIKALWFQTLTRFSSSRYDYLVGCSQADVATFSPIARANLWLIENGANTTKFSGLAPRSPAKRLVTLGRFSSNKRLDRLIAALRALVLVDPDWTLDIVGVPSDLTAADIASLASGVQGKVRVHVGLDDAATGRILSTCSIFASASEYEGFGLVAIEAMSAGLLPVLENNSAYGALAARHEVVRVTDFASPPAAAGAILSAWKALDADPTGIRAALMNAADHYTWDTVSRRYFALYQDVLG